MNAEQSRVDWEEVDAEEVVARLHTNVDRFRGWGESTTKVRIVERDCELCNYDRMVRVIETNPEFPATVEYFCQNPNCPDFHEASVKNLGYICRR